MGINKYTPIELDPDSEDTLNSVGFACKVECLRLQLQEQTSNGHTKTYYLFPPPPLFLLSLTKKHLCPLLFPFLRLFFPLTTNLFLICSPSLGLFISFIFCICLQEGLTNSLHHFILIKTL